MAKPTHPTTASLERRKAVLERIQVNLNQTGHPFHHRTVSGVVVDADPTLEHLIRLLTDVAPVVPVDRAHYGFDPYEADTKGERARGSP